MYFPSFHGYDIECSKCEKEKCVNRGKHQRSRRDFEVTSGRCPRLPDRCGFVDMNERENQRNTYPIIHAEKACEVVNLSLSLPGDKRFRKVYRSKSGFWYHRSKMPTLCGSLLPIKQAISIEYYSSEEVIMEYMDSVGSDYCLLPCHVLDFTV